MAAAVRPVRATFAGLKTELDVRAARLTVQADGQTVPSGFPELDYSLGGGFIRGSIASLEGPPSSGRTAVLAATISKATEKGLAAVVDEGTLFPPDLERAGVALERLIIASASRPLAAARCADALLRSRAFGVVAMPAVQLRGTIWSRLAMLAQKAGALLLTHGIHASTELGYFASTRVRCAIDRVEWSGSGCFCELLGYEVAAHVLKHRGIIRSVSKTIASC